MIRRCLVVELAQHVRSRWSTKPKYQSKLQFKKRYEKKNMTMRVYKSGGTHITSHNCQLACTTLSFSFFALLAVYIYTYIRTGGRSHVSPILWLWWTTSARSWGQERFWCSTAACCFLSWRNCSQSKRSYYGLLGGDDASRRWWSRTEPSCPVAWWRGETCGFARGTCRGHAGCRP